MPDGRVAVFSTGARSPAAPRLSTWVGGSSSPAASSPAPTVLGPSAPPIARIPFTLAKTAREGTLWGRSDARTSDGVGSAVLQPSNRPRSPRIVSRAPAASRATEPLAAPTGFAGAAAVPTRAATATAGAAEVTHAIRAALFAPETTSVPSALEEALDVAEALATLLEDESDLRGVLR
jgi:hypothetical protein